MVKVTIIQRQQPAEGVPDDPRSEKECTRCGQIKALGTPETSEFYIKYNRRRSDGTKQYYWSPECRVCWNKLVRARRDAQRANIGDEAYRAKQKEIRDRWRGGVRATAAAARATSGDQ